MRRIFLGLLAGAGAGWVAWSLRGWPPAYWKSAAAERTADAARHATSTKSGRQPRPEHERLPDVDGLGIAPLPEFSGFVPPAQLGLVAARGTPPTPR